VALFDSGTASATVKAVDFSQLWRINRSELLSFVTDNPGAGVPLVMGLAHLLAVRLRNTDPFETPPTGLGTD
jgi:CRP/FNR family transcriptional regulator, cyclic AMP receptor protein